MTPAVKAFDVQGGSLHDVKRHPSLAPLSRDHHRALVFAREARRMPGVDSDATLTMAALRRRFEEELAPHFLVEETELVGRCVACGELATLAAQVLADHAALRALVAALEPATLRSGCEAFADRLEAHVRFEERSWFPALEAQLGTDVLDALAAVLDHPRPSGGMPTLPSDVAPYKNTAVFDAETVPAALKRSHSLKADTWGEIVVEQGSVRYVLEDEEDRSLVLRPGVVGVIAPERPHHVEPADDARFFVRFSKRPSDP